MGSLKSQLHHAFGRTVKARAWALVATAVALAPELMPRDLATWIGDQTGAPSWACLLVAWLLAMFRFWRSSKAVRP